MMKKLPLFLILFQFRMYLIIAVDGTTKEIVNTILAESPEQDHLNETVTETIEDSLEEVLNGTVKEDLDGDGKAVTYPCNCNDGQCSCCTGNVLQNFNFKVRNRVCTNLTYDAEDTTIGVKLAFNDFALYKNKISARNPPPVCLPIPRLTALRVCLRLTNVFFVDRNVHACPVFESQWNKQPALVFNFDCIRLGTSGIALVKPEDGGGLPDSSNAVNSGGDDGIPDYDETIVPSPGRRRRSL